MFRWLMMAGNWYALKSESLWIQRREVDWFCTSVRSISWLWLMQTLQFLGKCMLDDQVVLRVMHQVAHMATYHIGTKLKVLPSWQCCGEARLLPDFQHILVSFEGVAQLMHKTWPTEQQVCMIIKKILDVCSWHSICMWPRPWIQNTTLQLYT